MPRHLRQEHNRAIIIAQSLLIVMVAFCSTATLAAAGEIAFEVKEPSGVDRVDWPVTSGIPFVRGEVADPDRIALFNDRGQELPLQRDVLARWPDGSIRWLLLDFQTGLNANESKTFTLRFGEDVRPAPVQSKLSAIAAEDNVTIDTGPLRMKLSPRQFRLFDNVQVDLDGDGTCEDDKQITIPRDAGIVLTTPDGEEFRRPGTGEDRRGRSRAVAVLPANRGFASFR